MVSTGGPLTVDGTGWEVWLQVVVMSRGRRRPCYLARWTVGSTTDQAPGVRDQGCNWRRRHADSGCARPQRGASQALPNGCTDSETPHWLGGTRPPPKDAILAVSRILAGSSVAPDALGCSSPRGNTCFDPCAVGPLSGCDAVLCWGIRRDRNADRALPPCWSSFGVLRCCAVSQTVSLSRLDGSDGNVLGRWLSWQPRGFVS